MAVPLSLLNGCVLSNSFIVSECTSSIPAELTKSCPKPTSKDDLVDLVAIGAQCDKLHDRLVTAVKHCQTQATKNGK